MKRPYTVCLVGTMCTSSLQGIYMVMIALFFLKLIPQPPWKWEMFPSLGGCPQGGGLYSAKKMNIFLFCKKKNATFASPIQNWYFFHNR